MTLKINYLDRQKGSSKNTALFLDKKSNISDFRGIFDDKINTSIIPRSKISHLNVLLNSLHKSKVGGETQISPIFFKRETST